MKTLSASIAKSPWTYFGATFLWSWSLCALLIFTDLHTRPALSFATIVLAMIGPGITGILFTYATRSRSDIRDYWRRVVDTKRLTFLWVAIAIALPFLLQAMAGAIDGLAGGVGLSWGESAPAFLESPATQLLSLATLSLVPFFEELGWRGYAQDALERTHSALGASLILGGVWALWHLPASFIPGTYQAALGIGTLEFWLHFVGIVLLSVVVSWIYINTNRSILIMVVLHATVNMAGELIQLSEVGEVIYTFCWASAAVAIVLAFGWTMRTGPVQLRGGAPGRAMIVLLAASGMSLSATALSSGPLEAQDLAARFQAELEAVHREYGFPGATAAYALPDGSVGVAVVGMADLEAGRAMARSSTMLAASVGKTFVGATALALVRDGRLRLDDPISLWLGDRPWFKRLANHDRITLAHLLTHTSGLPDHVQSESFARAFANRWRVVEQPMTPEELIAHILDQPALFAPGDGWGYSDTGYLLVGLIIEEAAGRPYYTEVAERFLIPLGLHATQPSNRVDLQELATGYVTADNPLGLPVRTTTRTGVMVWNPGVEWTGGGLVSSSADLARWARFLFEGDAMAGDYLNELLTGPTIDTSGPLRYGLGVTIQEGGALGTTLGHGGWIPGYCTSLRYYPEYGVAIAFQINTDVGVMDGAPSHIDLIEERLARVVMSDEANAGGGV